MLRGKKKPSERIIIGVIVFALLVVFAGYIIYINRNCKRILEDVAKAEFITYEGEFIHDDYQKDSFYHNIYISRMMQAIRSGCNCRILEICTIRMRVIRKFLQDCVQEQLYIAKTV